VPVVWHRRLAGGVVKDVGEAHKLGSQIAKVNELPEVSKKNDKFLGRRAGYEIFPVVICMAGSETVSELSAVSFRMSVETRGPITDDSQKNDKSAQHRGFTGELYIEGVPEGHRKLHQVKTKEKNHE
jgi:hypothetical protein